MKHKHAVKSEEKKVVVRYLWAINKYMEDEWTIVDRFMTRYEACEEIKKYNGGALHQLEWSKTEFPW